MIIPGRIMAQYPNWLRIVWAWAERRCINSTTNVQIVERMVNGGCDLEIEVIYDSSAWTGRKR